MPQEVPPLRAPFPAGRGPSGHDVILACAAAAVYFALALVPVSGLMVRRWKTAVPVVPWGDVLVLFSGMVAAAAAARAVAFAPSLIGTLRAAATAHGAAALATVALCVGLLVKFPGPRPLIAAETAEPLARIVYTRAIAPFFLFQLALGIAAALGFRAVAGALGPGRLDGDSKDAFLKWSGPWTLAALSVACYLAVVACARAGLGAYPRTTFTFDASPAARIAFVLNAIPVVVGALAAASTAGRIARSRLGSAIKVGVAAHLVAAAAAVLWTGLTWALYGYSVADQVHHGLRITQPITVSGVLAYALAGATASFLFWLLARPWMGAEDGRTVEPAARAAVPATSASGSNGVLVTCSGAFVYFALALIPVLGLMERGWQPRRYGGHPIIPGAELVVLVTGTLAMAAAAARAARARSLAAALDIGGGAHFVGAMLTAALTAFFVVPRLPPRLFQSGHTAIGASEMARGYAPYLVVQIALGLAATAIVHRGSQRDRLVKGSARTASPAPGWARAPVLAAAAAACFLAFDGLAVAPGLAEITGGRGVLDVRVRTTIALGGIALTVGALVAAASAGAIVRARASVAIVIGASVQFVGGCLVAPLAVPGMVLREYAAPGSHTVDHALQFGVLGTLISPYAVSLVPFGDALLFAIWSLTGGYGTVMLSWAALAILQAVIGAVSALLIWAATRPWARRAAAD